MLAEKKFRKYNHNRGNEVVGLTGENSKHLCKSAKTSSAKTPTPLQLMHKQT